MLVKPFRHRSVEVVRGIRALPGKIDHVNFFALKAIEGWGQRNAGRQLTRYCGIHDRNHAFLVTSAVRRWDSRPSRLSASRKTGKKGGTDSQVLQHLSPIHDSLPPQI